MVELSNFTKHINKENLLKAGTFLGKVAKVMIPDVIGHWNAPPSRSFVVEMIKAAANTAQAAGIVEFVRGHKLRGTLLFAGGKFAYNMADKVGTINTTSTGQAQPRKTAPPA